MISNVITTDQKKGLKIAFLFKKKKKNTTVIAKTVGLRGSHFSGVHGLSHRTWKSSFRKKKTWKWKERRMFTPTLQQVMQMQRSYSENKTRTNKLTVSPMGMRLRSYSKDIKTCGPKKEKS